MKEKIVIALGGNAIQTTEATAEAQQTAIRCAMQNLKPLFDSPARIVISHGN
ncbi:carbamate kinase, partial [Staphylococcus aureus]|nr:carbamate kinase [Staphylococcus aureus]